MSKSCRPPTGPRCVSVRTSPWGIQLGQLDGRCGKLRVHAQGEHEAGAVSNRPLPLNYSSHFGVAREDRAPVRSGTTSDRPR
jgi:hypothetical protein